MKINKDKSFLTQKKGYIQNNTLTLQRIRRKDLHIL